jgi:hypothetical protein
LNRRIPRPQINALDNDYAQWCFFITVLQHYSGHIFFPRSGATS